MIIVNQNLQVNPGGAEQCITVDISTKFIYKKSLTIVVKYINYDLEYI